MLIFSTLQRVWAVMYQLEVHFYNIQYVFYNKSMNENISRRGLIVWVKQRKQYINISSSTGLPMPSC